jgi:hypothetical protein
VKRRSKVVEVFPKPVSAEKVVYLVAVEMDESYRKRKVKGFEEVREELMSMRRKRYGGNGRGGGGGDGGGKCEEIENNLKLNFNKFHIYKS